MLNSSSIRRRGKMTQTALAQLLEDELAEAKEKTGSAVSRRLKNGLHIVLVARENEVVVGIWRNNAFPSISEWDTVMKNFPYATPKVLPSPKQKGSRYMISAKVPSQGFMQLKFG